MNTDKKNNSFFEEEYPAEHDDTAPEDMPTKRKVVYDNDSSDGLQRLGILAKIYKKKVPEMWLPLALSLGGLLIVFFIISIFTMNANNKELYNSQLENGALQQDLDAQNNVLLEKNQKYAEQILLNAFDSTQLENLAKDNWTYSVTVNNVAVNGDIITVKSPNVVIKINEKEKKNDLPESISVMGSISKGKEGIKLDDIVKISTSVNESQIKSEVVHSEETDETTYTYSISNVPVGDIITIDLGTDLASRLRIKSGYVEIIHPSNS